MHLVERNTTVWCNSFTVKDEKGGDIWNSIFSRAHQDHGEKTDDIKPFWVFQIDSGAQIERHVPAFS